MFYAYSPWGRPTAGNTCGKRLCCGSTWPGRPDPSALDLLPLHMGLFNRTHSKAPAIPYTLAAGDARADGLPTLFRELPSGDGLVSTWSALGVEGYGVRHGA